MSEKVVARTAWIYCAWPGLAQLWKNGAVAGLVLAVGFAMLLNLAVVVSFGWTEVLGSSAKSITWLVVLAIWLIAGGASYLQLRREAAKQTVSSSEDDDVAAAGDTLFVQATNEYLKGNWYEAEQLLEALLRHDSGDAEARLMWATMCRHTGRLEEARRRLDELSLRERAAAWSVEIENERHLIEREFARIRELDEEPIETINSSQTNTAA